MKKILFYALLVVMLLPIIASAQTTNEVKYHKYKDFAHDSSDIKWAVGQSIRAYINSLGLDTLPAWMDSVEVAINNNAIAISAIVTDLATNYWTSAVTKAYIDGTDEATIAALNTQISRYNQTGSSGAITDATIASDGSGGIIISPFSYAIKTSDSNYGELAYFTSDTVEIASADLTDDAVNWIYVDYNSGTPTFNDTVTYSDIRRTDQFLVGFLYKDGTNLTITTHGTEIANFVAREEARIYSRGIVERMSGIILGEKATRYLTLTSGVLYSGISRSEPPARDSSVTNFAGYWSYNSGTTTWANNVATYPNQIDNDKYNNIATGALTSLTSNRYGVPWGYISGGYFHVVFGQGDYTLALAQASQPPSTLPAQLADMGLLVGRIIIKKGDDVFTETDSAFNVMFSPSGVTNHNDLANRDEASSHPGTAVSVDASGFDGNLATTDDTVQKVAQKLDDLTVPSLTNYYTKAQTESTVAVMINDNAQAKYWYANNMVSGDYTGEVLIATVASSQTQYYAVYMSSSGLAAADSDAYATLPTLGVILETGTGDKKVLVKGLVRNDSWNWTVGGRVYVSGSAGQLTQTAPTTAGTMINIIGIAVHADILYVCPSTTVVEN